MDSERSDALEAHEHLPQTTRAAEAVDEAELARAERVEATRAAVRTLADEDITDAALRRIGVTEERFEELVDADEREGFWEYHAERAAAREFDREYGLNRDHDDCYGL